MLKLELLKLEAMMKLKLVCSLASILTLTAFGSLVGCSGMRKTDSTFYTHAEAFRIVGFAIPEDDQVVARRLVPPDAKIETILSTPADWKSVVGVIGNIFWIHSTRISGTLPDKS